MYNNPGSIKAIGINDATGLFRHPPRLPTPSSLQTKPKTYSQIKKKESRPACTGKTPISPYSLTSEATSKPAQSTTSHTINSTKSSKSS